MFCEACILRLCDVVKLRTLVRISKFSLRTEQRASTNAPNEDNISFHEPVGNTRCFTALTGEGIEL